MVLTVLYITGALSYSRLLWFFGLFVGPRVSVSRTTILIACIMIQSVLFVSRAHKPPTHHTQKVVILLRAAVGGATEEHLPQAP